MSAAPPAARPPSSVAIAVVFATILHVALVIGTSGILALALDRDVIDYPDAGPILGPVMIATGAVVVALAARAAARARHPWPAAVAGAVGAAAVTVVIGALGYALVRGELAWVLLATVHFATTPLALTTLGCAFVALVVAWSLARLRRVPREDDEE
jgi:hypothetical protein